MGLDNTRHTDIFDPEGFEDISITIIGVGAIGSFLAPSIVRMGLKKFVLYDEDKVERHNLALQYFNEQDIGMPKTEATGMKMASLSSDIEIDNKIAFFTKKDSIETDIVIACTDNIKSRKLVYNRAKKNKKVKLLIDARMAGELFVIFTVDMTNKEAKKKYERSFHQETEQSCTARGIIYTSNIISGFVCNQIKRVLENSEYFHEITFDCGKYGVITE